tara:strand:- start:764 stop:1165 length:402 start_codon:yes stop_codon:yes gene_type:complete
LITFFIRKNIIKNPGLIFGTSKVNLNTHFDMHHEYGNLDKAINLLDVEDTENFRKYVNSSYEMNPHIMFITRPEVAYKWFKSLFTWLEKCEPIFGFHELKGYDTTRIYAYLAERYLSYWFKNIPNTKNIHGHL